MSPGCWLLVALGALYGGEALLHPQVALPAVAISLWLVRRYLRGWSRLFFLCVLGLSVLRAHLALAGFIRERDAVLRQMGASERCAGRGRLVSSPQWQKEKFVLVVESDDLQCERPVAGRHRVRIVGGPDGLARGDEIAFVAQLGIVAPLAQLELTNPMPRATAKQIVASGGALSVERLRCGRGLRNLIDRARSKVRQRIVATYAPAASALGRALVLGENDLLPEEQLAFQKSGLSHLLAVSGTHLVFAVVSLVMGLRALLLRVVALSSRTDVRLWTSPLGAIVALLYADFAGGSGSAWRAAFMLSAVYLATTLKRRLRGLHALAYSILVGAIIDPWVGYDLSFLLSAGATAGLITLGSSWSRVITDIKSKWLRWVCAPLATTMSAMIPCVPLLLLLSPELTLAGIAANVVAGPIGELMALPLCLLHAVASPLPWLEAGLALSGSGALLAVGFIAKLSAQLTFTQVALPPPTSAQYLCLGATCLAYVTLGACSRRWRLGMLALGALSLVGLEGVARSAGAPRGSLRVTAVDVGQGDAIVVDLPDGRVMLVDGGGSVTGGPDPGRFVLAPLLRARRRAHLDIVVMTHPHPDHYGGLVTLLPGLSVGEFWIAGAPGALGPGNVTAELYEALKRRGTKIKHLPELCQSPLLFAAARVEVMGPCPNADLGRNANNQSIVLRLSLGRRAVLLAGDAEFLEEEELLVTHGSRLRADLLKIGHHGSRSSTSERWLSTVKPAMALISVGARNRFGHPHATTLERLTKAHVPVYRTDQLGAIQWRTDGEAITVTAAHVGWGLPGA